MQRTEKVIEIDAPIERVFDMFSDFENFPRWMSNIKDVHYTGRRFSRWTARAPLGTSVEWEAETTIFEPDRRIAWRTVRGDVNTNGEVIFESTRRGTTLLRVILGYEVPAGRLGALVASLFGKNPEQELEEDLHSFARIAEGREQAVGTPRTDDRPTHDSQQKNSQGQRQEHEGNLQWQQREDNERGQSRQQQQTFNEGSNEVHPEELRGREVQSHEGQRAPEPVTNRHALTPRERARELEMERERRLQNVPEETRKVFRRGVDRLSDEGPSTRWRRN